MPNEPPQRDTPKEAANHERQHPQENNLRGPLRPEIRLLGKQSQQGLAVLEAAEQKAIPQESEHNFHGDKSLIDCAPSNSTTKALEGYHPPGLLSYPG